jgi:hypothetical protein
MENFRLKVFRTVADNLNFRQAAEALYLTQPAVTLQIKVLEEELGVSLFDRTENRVALTEAERIVLEHAKKGKLYGHPKRKGGRNLEDRFEVVVVILIEPTKLRRFLGTLLRTFSKARQDAAFDQSLVHSGSQQHQGISYASSQPDLRTYNLHAVRLPGLKSMQRRARVEDHSWLIEDHWSLLRMNDLQLALP